MRNKRVFQSNLFAMILLILYATTPEFLKSVFARLNLPQYLYIILPQLILLLGPTIIYFIMTKNSVKNTLRFNKMNFKSIFIVILIGFFAQPIATFLSLITQFVFPNRVSQVVLLLNNIPFIARVFVVALTPAIFEEITMRGVVLSGYDNVDIKKSAIMTGMFFGILHMDGNQFLYAMVLGIIFAYLVRITNSIFSSMICHFTINGCQVALSHIFTNIINITGKDYKDMKNSSLLDLPKNELINDLSLSLILGIICLGIVIVLIKRLIRINGNKEFNNINKCDDIKVLNWPVYISIAIYIFIIIGQLVNIYK